MMRRLQQAKARRTAAAVAAAASPATLTLRNPNDIELNSQMEQAVMNLRRRDRPPNTIKALHSKAEECMQFCDKVYPQDPYRYTLDRDRAHRFMWYQAFREQKPRGGNKKTLYRGDFFDYEDYQKTVPAGDAASWAVTPSVKKPIGKAMFTQYKASLRSIYKDQTVRRVINCHWEGIWTEAFEDLEKHVKERVPQTKRATHQEKASGEFARRPFKHGTVVC